METSIKSRKPKNKPERNSGAKKYNIWKIHYSDSKVDLSRQKKNQGTLLEHIVSWTERKMIKVKRT